jgi:hypothetical protein
MDEHASGKLRKKTTFRKIVVKAFYLTVKVLKVKLNDFGVVQEYFC